MVVIEVKCCGNCKENADDRVNRQLVCNIAIDGYIPRVNFVEKNKTNDFVAFWKETESENEERKGLIASMAILEMNSFQERVTLEAIKKMCNDVLADRMHMKEEGRKNPRKEELEEEGWGWNEMVNATTLDQLETSLNEYDQKMIDYEAKLEPLVKEWLKKRDQR